MKRRRIVAGVILLAAVAVLFAAGVWERVAYRETIEATGKAVRIKRWEWLPGAAEYVPHQPCTLCRMGKHSGCWGTRPPADLRTFRCTCTDASHDEVTK